MARKHHVAKRIEILLCAVEAVALSETAKTGSSVMVAPRQATETGQSRLIYLVEDDEMQARDLTLQLRNFGYEVTRVFRPGGDEAGGVF